MLRKSLIVSLLSVIAYALPSGSPYCEIDQSNMAIFEKNHSPQSSSTGFSAEFIPDNGRYRIVLTRKDVPIHGVLMFVTGEDKSTHLGSFTSKPGFRFAQGCRGNKESTITHEDGGEKTDTEFIWTPGSNEKGPFTLTAVISGNQNPWSMIKINQAQTIDQSQNIEPVRRITQPPAADPYENLPFFGNEKPEEYKPTITSAAAVSSQTIEKTSAASAYYPSATDDGFDSENIHLNGVSSKGSILTMAAIFLFGVLF